jgi:hypothetical protein
VGSLRGIKRMEFPQSVRKKAFVWCCRNGVPHCEGCGIEINARTGIISEHVIPAGLGGQKIDAIRAKQASKPKHSPLPQNRDDFQRAGKRHDEIRARPRRGIGEAVPGGAARTRGEAGRVPEGVTRVTRARLI